MERISISILWVASRRVAADHARTMAAARSRTSSPAQACFASERLARARRAEGLQKLRRGDFCHPVSSMVHCSRLSCFAMTISVCRSHFSFHVFRCFVASRSSIAIRRCALISASCSALRVVCCSILPRAGEHAGCRARVGAMASGRTRCSAAR